MLKQARGGWKDDVGGGRAKHDHVQFGSLDPGRFHGPGGRMKGEIAGCFTIRGLASLTDSRARAYPLVTGLDEFFEILVGDDLFRQIAASARNA